MAKLNLIIPKGSVPDWLKSILITIQNWARNISGDCLTEGSVEYNKLALASRSVPPGKIGWPEWHIPLALPSLDTVTQSTDYVRCSGVFYWTPLLYPTMGGTWHLEASIAIDTAAGTVAVRLMGDDEVGAVTRTGETTMDVVRSPALTMPTSAENLYCEFKVGNAAHIGSFSGARLIFVPN